MLVEVLFANVLRDIALRTSQEEGLLLSAVIALDVTAVLVADYPMRGIIKWAFNYQVFPRRESRIFEFCTPQSLRD